MNSVALNSINNSYVLTYGRYMMTEAGISDKGRDYGVQTTVKLKTLAAHYHLDIVFRGGLCIYFAS